MVLYIQTARQLFEKFKTYISQHGTISGPYGDILYSIGFPHRHLVAHGATLFELSSLLFTKIGVSFEYTYADEDGYDTGEQITPTESPYYEDVHIHMAVSVALSQKAAEVATVVSENQPVSLSQETTKSRHLETAEQLFAAFRQLFSAFLARRSRQGDFCHSGSYVDLLHTAQISNHGLVAHGGTLAELARLFKEIHVSFTYCYADEDGNPGEEQIPPTDDADYEDVFVSLSC